jgi:hypothetical protein
MSVASRLAGREHVLSLPVLSLSDDVDQRVKMFFNGHYVVSSSLFGNSGKGRRLRDAIHTSSSKGQRKGNTARLTWS